MRGHGKLERGIPWDFKKGETRHAVISGSAYSGEMRRIHRNKKTKSQQAT
jgi:hypothetical protein